MRSDKEGLCGQKEKGAVKVTLGLVRFPVRVKNSLPCAGLSWSPSPFSPVRGRCGSSSHVTCVLCVSANGPL